jgi:outer membrane protein assembly factor BamE (lipoprotein component of BamABCDE complex)
MRRPASAKGAGAAQPDMGDWNRMKRPAGPPCWVAARVAATVVALGLLLGGCFFSETYQRGYIVPDGALEQIPMGSTQEQVLIVLGTPSTVATVSGEAFYYISQRAERSIGFMPQQVVDQRVIAVYFDKNRRVERLANYGMRDGRLFDFVSRTTPTGGKDYAYINAMFKIF